jgi:glycosyltransferase involved in cell wall biosynthesis
MKITGFLSDIHACGPVRLEVPAREVNKRFPNHDYVCKTDVQISDFTRSNVMVWQRASESDLLPKVNLATSQGIKNIYELDDDVFNIPEKFQKPYIHYAKPEVRESITALMRACDAVTVSTNVLAQSVQPYVSDKPIFVVENSLDVERWEEDYAKKQNTKKDTITIGWMASGSHTIDAPLVIPALLRALKEDDRVRVKLIGWVGWDIIGEKFDRYRHRIDTSDWVNYVQLPKVMREIDIGICPLIDNLFNRSKSNLKWLQYSALGAATVASDLDPYKDIEDGVDGLLVEETQEAWSDAIMSLLKDDKKRVSMGNEARETLLKKWDVRNRAADWVTVFDAVCQ